MSLELQEHCSLKPYNTFGIDVRTRLLAHARDEADVREALALARERGLPLLVIGGGSNLLLTRDVEALVLRMASQGRRVFPMPRIRCWSRRRRARPGTHSCNGAWNGAWPVWKISA